MEEEEVPDMAPAIRSLAITATAEFLLLIGIVFVLLGVANFLTDYLKIKGSGESLVGVAIIFIAFILLLRARPAPRPLMPEKTIIGRPEKESGDYR